ncbi:hypothetical protein PLESTB_000517300 [Pleodorina starrii]|uniref:NIF system FeS cluster assembly NifU C-terminal domain-containing protein n=1 Tax=Pleodorina starrii TaxID=330485 RepID=A0A9W6BHG5_9CHLO|nr:hypothetical protein PLESTB_000517300 [Pleodorina starrii]
MTGSSFSCSTRCTQRVAHGAGLDRARAKAFQPIRNAKACATQRPAVLAVTIVDDKSVPEAHKGLHGFLYGDGGSEEHDRGNSYTVRTGEDEGAVVMPVPTYLETRDGEKPLGVYCVYDAQRAPQYIGYSRNMVLAVKGHLARVGPQQCAHVRAMVYGNRAMASRTNLERGVANWVNELPELGGRMPRGNADAELRAAWEGGVVVVGGGAEAGGGEGLAAAPAPLDRRLMSPAEMAAYEEKKLKMRKAMGEKMVEGPGGAGGHAEEQEEEDDLATRRLKLMKAMDRGDWSAVINAQTQEALGGDAPAAEASGSGGGAAAAESSSAGGSDGGEAAAGTSTSGGGGGGGGIVSPFQEGGAAAAAASTESGGSGAAGRRQQQWQPQPLTVEAVQAALEEVRPYLMADGGDVEVVEVKDGVVYLRLQGACSSCPSQSATMKGGIERVIKQTFGDQVRDILQLDAVDPAATAERVDAALNMLRGAIVNLGGSAEVLSVADGVCTIRYKGPPAIGKGVSGAIKDTFSDIREVRLVD